MPPERLNPRHAIDDDDPLTVTLATDMAERGWQGRPILAINRGNGIEQITGHHRAAAAIRAGLDTVPVVLLDLTDHITGVVETAQDGYGCTACGTTECQYIGLLSQDEEDSARVLRGVGETEAADLLDAEVA